MAHHDRHRHDRHPHPHESGEHHIQEHAEGHLHTPEHIPHEEAVHDEQSHDQGQGFAEPLGQEELGDSELYDMLAHNDGEPEHTFGEPPIHARTYHIKTSKFNLRTRNFQTMLWPIM